MRKLLATTCLVAMTATSGLAQSADGVVIFVDPAAQGESVTNAMHASTLIGKRVYTSETEVAADPMTAASTDWNDVGEVSDIILTPGEGIDSILVDIGGFLGIGEKTVAVNMDQLRIVPDGDSESEYFVVFTADQAMLESAPEYREEPMEAAVADGTAAPEAATESSEQMAETATDPAVAPATEETAEMAPGALGMPPTVEREGYATVAAGDMTAEELTGAAVYDAKDEWIGEVSELILSDDGQVKEAVVDVGGFLGMGEKPVAVSLESMTISKQTEGGDLRVYVDATKEQLEAMPDYDG